MYISCCYIYILLRPCSLSLVRWQDTLVIRKNLSRLIPNRISDHLECKVKTFEPMDCQLPCGKSQESRSWLCFNPHQNFKRYQKDAAKIQIQKKTWFSRMMYVRSNDKVSHFYWASDHTQGSHLVSERLGKSFHFGGGCLHLIFLPRPSIHVVLVLPHGNSPPVGGNHR